MSRRNCYIYTCSPQLSYTIRSLQHARKSKCTEVKQWNCML